MTARPVTARTIRPMGEAAFLVEVVDLDTALGFQHALQLTPVPGQTDAVAGARTVVVRFGGTDRAAVLDHLRSVEPVGRSRTTSQIVIDTVYDGEDLVEVGRLTGLGADGVVRAHAASVWTVAFAGFAPGFGYLAGGDPRLHVQRREHPRTEVPAGAVGLAGEFSGIYPRPSPGGWQLIGRTAARLWDLDRDPPALLVPGATVRFRDAG